MDVHHDLSATLGGYEMALLDRGLRELVSRCRIKGVQVPAPVFDFAVDLNRAVNASPVSAHPGTPTGAAEAWKTWDEAFVSPSGEPATFSVAEAARAMKVTERRVRQLVQYGVLEVRAGRRPMRLHVDSVAAHLERKRRTESERRTA